MCAHKVRWRASQSERTGGIEDYCADQKITFASLWMTRSVPAKITRITAKVNA